MVHFNVAILDKFIGSSFDLSPWNSNNLISQTISGFIKLYAEPFEAIFWKLELTFNLTNFLYASEKIAFIDINYIINNSSKGKKILSNLEKIDKLLWTFEQNSFLPHKFFEPKVTLDTPILLLTEKYLNNLLIFKEYDSIINNFDEEIRNFKQICPIEMLDKLDNPISLRPITKKVS